MLTQETLDKYGISQERADEILACRREFNKMYNFQQNYGRRTVQCDCGNILQAKHLKIHKERHCSLNKSN